MENRIVAKQEQKRAMVDIALGTGDNNDLRQQREKFGALTKQDVFDLLNPDMELPDGIMRDDVRDNLKLFSPTTKAPLGNASARTLTMTSGPANKAPGATYRAVAKTTSKTSVTAPVGPKKSVFNVPGRVPGRVPAKRQLEAGSRFATSIADTPSYQSSVKKPENGPTDWKRLLEKHGGQKRRRFQ